jgi:serine/threonine protein phosphatase PrpC
MVRPNNEDSCLVVPPWSSLSLQTGVCLFAVADGMGGQNAGEVASGLAVKTARNLLKTSFVDEFSVSAVEEMFAQINQEIWGYAQKHPEASGMGTTFTMLILKGSAAIIGHIGDSRLYRMRNKVLEQITHDHSLVAEQVRMGKLTPEQARVHPTRHILSRVLGVRQFVEPDVFEIELQKGDTFLLCSDGVSGMIEDNQIAERLRSIDPARTARAIINAANAAGGKDNSTAVIVKIEELPVEIPGKYSLKRLQSILAHWGDAGTF